MSDKSPRESIAAATGPAISVVRWMNALSIDAVVVGVLWQTLFACSFRGSWPTIPESVTLGTTLWLIYTADHLLDARSLDIDRMHTFRHLVHLRHRSALVALWSFLTVCDAVAIITWLPDSLIRWGLGMAAAVLVYGAGVHFRPKTKIWLAKEFQVGILFAIGVGLLAWDHAPSVSLLFATMLCAVLFSANCIIVAHFDREADREQQFSSIATKQVAAVRYLPTVMAAVATIAIAGAAVNALPRLIACSIVISSVMLAALAHASCIEASTTDATLANNRFNVRHGLADATLIAPILIGWLA
ncbi:hypothetical protein Poly51_47030 [Rubripirellula tenax]|uniref:Prenyltransferase n=1 Tax=Rubripirellula tenax TaxID=2528015 RepID=A0A5C6EN92_9BACT|nr:hypothetical protein [Rubripirellula tenax]TWU48799.1 hypothetical protein Poly51_47030 [Rubripirellula tenax]